MKGRKKEGVMRWTAREAMSKQEMEHKKGERKILKDAWEEEKE